MNISTLSKEYDQINGIVNIVPYQINKLGLYPFLQYFLLKYQKIERNEEGKLIDEGKDEYVSFLKFDQLKFMPILETCVTALDILFLSYEELDPKYKYNGHIFYEGEYYMFFDCSEYQISTHNLNKQNDIWLTLVDEIINYKIVCQIKIEDKVSNFFLNHQDFIKVLKPDLSSNYYESPIVAYIGCNNKKRDFISTFGQIPANNGLYNFTGFNDVYIDKNSKCSSIIRFAIFPGNMYVLIDNIDKQNILDIENDEENEDIDWTIYDSIYLDKTWIIKNYNQQVILTSHLRENDKLYII